MSVLLLVSCQRYKILQFQSSSIDATPNYIFKTFYVGLYTVQCGRLWGNFCNTPMSTLGSIHHSNVARLVRCKKKKNYVYIYIYISSESSNNPHTKKKKKQTNKHVQNISLTCTQNFQTNLEFSRNHSKRRR